MKNEKQVIQPIKFEIPEAINLFTFQEWRYITEKSVTLVVPFMYSISNTGLVMNNYNGNILKGHYTWTCLYNY